MFLNYIKIAVRTLGRQKGYSFINIAGLTIGLTCCLLIFQYVIHEYSFDNFHENEDDLYRVVLGYGGRGAEVFDSDGGTFTPQALGPELEGQVPEIRYFSRLHPEYSGAIISNPNRPEQVFEEERVFYTDPEFLEMFTFPLITGTDNLEPGTILITESAAEKYFRSENPIGQTLRVTGQVDQVYQVTGILKNVPANSHLQFDFLLPMDGLLSSEQYLNEPEGGWSSNNFVTYLQLHPGSDLKSVDAKMTEVLMNRRGDVIREQGFTNPQLSGQPLHDVYLNDKIQSITDVTGSYRSVYFFSIIGLITLLIALVNYINLATARALDRSREVGLRKVVGADRAQLIRQFLFESAMTNSIAAVLAIFLAIGLTPYVNNAADLQLSNAIWMQPGFWGVFLVIFFTTTVLAGLYPAFVLSSFKPVDSLKGEAGLFSGQLWLRRGLVVFQFAAAIVLICGTTIVYNQLSYMRSLDLGMDLDQVITVPGPRVLSEDVNPAEARSTFADELRRLPGVRNVATSWSLPGQGFNWHGASTWRAENEENTAISAVVTYVDTSFVNLYDLELIAGHGFFEATAPFGSASPTQVLANETAIRSLGFVTPEDALNHPLKIGGMDVRIIGVLKDFNWTSAHAERQSIFFGYTTAGGHVSVRVGSGSLQNVIASIEETYTTLFAGNPFAYSFADQQFDRQYRKDQQFATLFAGFSGLAIFIACLGLFGLTANTARKRIKEIGIRKVLGASVFGIVSLLSKDFIRLVIISILIAVPVSWYAMNRWLEDFAYRIEIGPDTFLLAGFAAVIIALATVSWQSLKAAMMNPVNSLRSE